MNWRKGALPTNHLFSSQTSRGTARIKDEQYNCRPSQVVTAADTGPGLFRPCYEWNPGTAHGILRLAAASLYCSAAPRRLRRRAFRWLRRSSPWPPVCCPPSGAPPCARRCSTPRPPPPAPLRWRRTRYGCLRRVSCHGVEAPLLRRRGVRAGRRRLRDCCRSHRSPRRQRARPPPALPGKLPAPILSSSYFSAKSRIH
jgi:hypothetical protein